MIRNFFEKVRAKVMESEVRALIILPSPHIGEVREQLFADLTSPGEVRSQFLPSHVRANEVR